MKTILSTGMFLFLFVSMLFAQTPVDSSLVLYYRFDGNALDSGIYENDGTTVDALKTRDRFGTDSAAYDFNGSSAYIQIPNSESLSSPDSQITQMAWIYMNGWSKSGDDFNPILMKSSSGSNDFHYRMFISPSGLGVNFNSWFTGHTASYDFHFYRWYMVAVTYAADTLHYLERHRISTGAISIWMATLIFLWPTVINPMNCIIIMVMVRSPVSIPVG